MGDSAIGLFSGALFFDTVFMNTRSIGILTASSLVILAGCASSSPRSGDRSPSQASGQIEMSPDAYCELSEQQVSSRHASPRSDELVIGEMVDDSVVPIYPDPITYFTIDEIRLELEAMYSLDRELLSSLDSPVGRGLQAPTIRAIDIAQSNRLKEIVAHIGWPTRDLVGLKATQGAYMVIQHAGHDVDFQNESLSMMVDLVEQGELPASYIALLTDRIRVFQNQPQVFGTQMQMALDEHGVMVPTPSVPIDSPEYLDDRRALMGMPPHQEFVRSIQITYEASLVDTGSAFAEVSTDE